MEETIINLSNQKTEIRWTPYLAIAYAEGFLEGENATLSEQIEAWAVIAKLKLHRDLQGFFGRTVNHLIEQSIIDWDGNINWLVIELDDTTD
jgi:hypothetical protein